eukprot:4934832-Pleurochrysis_carterae.AAC.5
MPRGAVSGHAPLRTLHPLLALCSWHVRAATSNAQRRDQRPFRRRLPKRSRPLVHASNARLLA